MYRFIFFSDSCDGVLANLQVKSDKAWKRYLLARTEKLCDISKKTVEKGIELPARLSRRLLRQECMEFLRNAASYVEQEAAEKWINDMEKELNTFTFNL